MKKIVLGWIGKVLRGLLNGDLKMVLTPSEKKTTSRRGRPPAVKKKAGKKSKPGKPGRRPLPPAAKKKAKLQAKAQEARQSRKALPAPRVLFQLLQDKLEGLTLSEIVGHFKVKRILMKRMLEKCVKKDDLSVLKGKYFLLRRLRAKKGEAAPAKKAPPVSASTFLEYLAANGPTTLAKMAQDMNESGYHRLIKVAAGLKKEGKVAVEAKTYRLVEAPTPS